MSIGERETSVALSVRGLSSGYGGLQVLREVDLDITAGETVAITGLNGAGKTTLLSTIAGLLSPMQGRVEMHGRDVTTLKAHQIARLGMSYCLEERRLFGPMTVAQNLRLARVARSYEPDEADAWERTLSLFPRVKARLAQRCETLSGGEQQMVAMARALIVDPKLLLLDDPCLGLAPIIAEGIFEALEELKRAGLTIVLVDQDEARAVSFSHRAMRMENGSLVHIGSNEPAAAEIAGVDQS